MKLTKQDVIWAAWGITFFAVAAGFVVWGDSMDWEFGGMNNYRLFPLFGLMAFSLMWSHYIVSAIRKYAGVGSEVTKDYFETTSLMALIALCLHPGLLSWELWKDGMGLPPASYYSNYVAPGLRWLTLLGTVSLLVFIAYEFRRRFKEKQWWKWVQYASDTAMLAIFYHGLRLGTHLQSGWFQVIWYIFGIGLVASLIYLYLPKAKQLN